MSATLLTGRFLRPFLCATLWFASSLLSQAQTTPATGAVSSGTNYTLTLKADGTVWAWGLNTSGQLGLGNTTNTAVPVAIPGLTGVAAIATGDAHSIALKTDGTVRTWGRNTNSQLGDTLTTDRSTPYQPPSLTNIIAIAAGDSHSLFLKNDGTVWACGLNIDGQLGIGGTLGTNTIVQVKGINGIGNLINISAIAAGSAHSIARRTDGTVCTWGLNANGQLGDNSTTTRRNPYLIPSGSLSGVIAIAAGDAFSLALKNDNSVRAWGLNISGQLGDGTTTQRIVPVAVSSLAGATAISAGDTHALALKADGTAFSWGLNSSAQLGIGNTTNGLAPVQIPGVATALALAGGTSHTHLLLSDGRLLSFGDNTNGQLGDGLVTPTRLTLVQPTAWTDVSALATGASHSLAVRSSGNGTVWSWGLNNNGQLGDNSTTLRRLPVQVPGLANITQVAAGASHSLALTSNGTLRTWGLNTSGQLGNGNTTQSLLPLTLTSPSGLTAITAIAAGDNHSLALKTGGFVWVWGLNTNGQLGDGLTASRTSAFQLTSLSNATAVAAGNSHSLALKSDGTVWAWGLNTNGRLGDNSTTQRPAPVQVRGLGGVGNLTNVAAIAAAGGHSLALRTDGTLYAWGLNANGQLGDNSTTQRLVPVQVKGPGGVGNLTGVTAIAAGEAYSLAILNDGTARAWGLNTGAQLGNGNLTQSTTPLTITGLSSASRLAAGDTHALALRLDQTLRAWGDNTNGALGSPDVLTSAAAISLKTTGGDTDADGLPDVWETTNWGNLTQTGSADPDTDGLTNVQEYLRGTNPTQPDADLDLLTDPVDTYPADYYNALVPTLTILSGNNQTTPVSQFNPLPFDVAVWNSATPATPFVNAPVTFTVLSGGGQVAVTAAPPLSTTLTRRTDIDGTTKAFYQQPSIAGTSQIRVTAGAAQVTFNTNSADTTAPTVPAGLASASITATSFTLSWTPSTDVGSLVTTLVYDVYLGGSPLGATTAGTTSYLVTGLAPSTGYSMTVRARDATGNFSAQSAPFLVNTAPDTTAPTVPSGLASSAIAGTSFTLTWTASTDNVSAPSAIVYDVFRNGAAIGTTAPGVTTFPVSGLISGTTYAMTVLARDAAGNNSAQSTARNVTTTDIIAPSVPAGLGSTAITATSFTLNWAASTDNVSAPSALNYEVFLGGVSRGTTAAGVTSRAITGLASSTTYSMTVRSRDAAGNFSAQSTAFNVTTADNIVPSVPSGLTSSAITPRSFTLSWTAATDNFSASSALVYDVYRSGNFLGTTAAGITSYSVTGLASSSTYAMTVRTRDTAGNNSAQSSALNVTTAVNPDQVSAGYDFTLALRADGSVWSWGNNINGQLGQGSTIQLPYPNRITTLGDVKAIAAGRTYALAVTVDGRVWAWGDNYYGQLGDGTTDQRLSPVPIAPSTLTTVISVAAAQYHSLALRADGTVWAWGYNGYGQLGDGTNTSRNQPGQVPGLTNVVAVAAGSSTSFALKSDGTVWAWGSGYLGAGSSLTNSSVPVSANTIANVVAISCSYEHVLALKANGTVWAWGNNSDGQLGDGTTNPTYSALAVPLTGQYTAIAAGYYHSLATRTDGTCFAWGSNGNGRLGLGSITSQFTTPQSLGTLALATTLAASNHSVWIAPYQGSAGSPLIYSSAGPNNSGQLGDTTTTDRLSPVPVAFASDLDLDGDGLSNALEVTLGSNPLNADSNGDRLPDNVAYASGYSLTANDTDGDGLSNAFELANGLDPLRADTDGDGVNDATDAYPLDATISSGSAQQGDTTPPIVTLTAPLGATLLP